MGTRKTPAGLPATSPAAVDAIAGPNAAVDVSVSDTTDLGDQLPTDVALPLSDGAAPQATNSEGTPMSDFEQGQSTETPNAYDIAAQIVSGTPNVDLVEAVRRVLAREVPTPVAAIAVSASLRLGHVALMHLHHNGRPYAPFDMVFVTEAEFEALKSAQVFDGYWDEGVEEA